MIFFASRMCAGGRVAPLRAVWMAVIGIVLANVPMLAAIDQDEAVPAGAEALDSWWDYPWYDDQTDGIRRVELKAKTQQPTPAPSSGSSDFDWVGWLLIAVLAVAVLVMIIRAYWNRDARPADNGRAGAVGSAASVEKLEELSFQLDAPTDDMLTAARRAYEQGDYGRAVILLYSHQLLELDKRDAIRLTKGKTNRQYLRELQRRSDLAALLSTSMVAFEDVFFGGHSLSRERFEFCWQRAMQLLAAADVREAA
jgi:hypothetical protein